MYASQKHLVLFSLRFSLKIKADVKGERENKAEKLLTASHLTATPENK